MVTMINSPKLKPFLLLLVLLLACALCSCESDTDEARPPHKRPPPPHRPPKPCPPHHPPPHPKPPHPKPPHHPPPHPKPPHPKPPHPKPPYHPPPHPKPPHPKPPHPKPPHHPPPHPKPPHHPPPHRPPTPKPPHHPPSRPEPGYDHFVLALTWPNGFCNQPHVTCGPSPPEQRYFTIHGLWPVDEGGSFLTDCEAEELEDEILEEMEDDQLTYSAKKFEYVKQLWRMLWFRHGSCSSNKFPPKQYFERGIALGKDYGEKILKDLKDEGINPDGSTEYSATSVLNSIEKGTGKKAIISCTKEKSGKLQLSEVRLCFDADAETLKDCTKTSPSCNENFIFASEQPPHATFLGLVSSMMEAEEAAWI